MSSIILRRCFLCVEKRNKEIYKRGDSEEKSLLFCIYKESVRTNCVDGKEEKIYNKTMPYVSGFWHIRDKTPREIAACEQ